MKKLTIQPSKIRAPHGYKFKIISDRGRKVEGDYVYIILLNSLTNREIGSLELERIHNRWITHSDLEEDYHNKGIGILLYAKGIQYCHKRNWKVSSSGLSSFDAQRLWASKRLRKLFRIVKKHEIETTWDGRRVKGEPTWFAYPLNKRAS